MYLKLAKALPNVPQKWDLDPNGSLPGSPPAVYIGILHRSVRDHCRVGPCARAGVQLFGTDTQNLMRL